MQQGGSSAILYFNRKLLWIYNVQKIA